MDDKAILLKWREIINEVAEEAREEEFVPTQVEEKSPKKPTFLDLFLYKPLQNFNKFIRKQYSKLQRFWNTDTTNDLKAIVSFVVGYGLLGEAVLLTFHKGWEISGETPIHILGAGAAIYLFMDLFKYIVDTIKARR